jgi:hypothetical protein
MALLTTAVFVLGFLVALFRLGLDLGGPRLWAEDGVTFFYHAATGENLGSVMMETWAGYLHLVPRLIVELLRLLPLAGVAGAVVVVCALVQALTAAVTVRTLVGFGVRPLLAVLPAAAVCAVPLGPEVILNLANLQWFLLFLSVLVLLWRPRTRRGAVLQGMVVLLTPLSSPFGVLIVALAALRAAVLRTRGAVALLVMSTAATAVQLVVMLAGRSIRPEPAPVRVKPFLAAYLRRVLADGLLGLSRLPDIHYSPEVTTGLVLVAAFLVLAVLAVRRRGAPVAVQLAVLLGMSFAIYLAPMVIAGGTGLDPIFQGRYAVAPALLWLCAISVASSAAVGADPFGVAAWVVVVAFTVGGVWGMVTSYSVQVPLRETEATWATQATTNEEACSTLSGDAAREFRTPPAGPFDFTLTCRQIEGW